MAERHAERVMSYLRRVVVDPEACPNCFSSNHYQYQTRTNMKCADCGKQFSPLWWTPFYRHKLPVGNLLQIAHLLLIEQLNMLQVAKRTGVDYKTVWSFRKKLDLVSDALAEDAGA